jgi:hypothetical protein
MPQGATGGFADLSPLGVGVQIGESVKDELSHVLWPPATAERVVQVE